MILYRPVGLQELALIYEGGMKAFPADLPQQPIFYPVLDLEYARQTASDWNVKRKQSAGYVTEFKVEDDYLAQFEKHTVGSSQYQEFWIPAEQLEEFNRHISGHIKVVAAYFGEDFQGILPEKFDLAGKDIVEQFTWLANAYLYKRMDFYLEIKRNHKAVFLNYPFWEKHEFKDQGLKKKVLQAIREAWWTSFPQVPLIILADEEQTTAKPADPESFEDDEEEDIAAREPDASDSPEEAGEENLKPSKLTYFQSQPPVRRVQEGAAPPKQTASYASHGIELGLRGRYHGAVDQLSRAVEEQPQDALAQTSLGVAYHKLGEDERALSCYEAALRIDPLQAEARLFPGEYSLCAGKLSRCHYRLSHGARPETGTGGRASTSGPAGSFNRLQFLPRRDVLDRRAGASHS